MFSFFRNRKVSAEKKAPKNLKLISLCLAYEVANADNEIDSKERDLLLNLIKENIDLSLVSEKDILQVIQEDSKKSISFYDIIRDINKGLNREEKVDIIKMLWEVAYADNALDVGEERIIKRSAEMLGIKPSIVLQTKDQFKVE